MTSVMSSTKLDNSQYGMLNYIGLLLILYYNWQNTIYMQELWIQQFIPLSIIHQSLNETYNGNISNV